ncbi:MAG TPA: S8 family serine peptidase [bacterium]|jgi:subtilisin family serine protease
MKRWLALLLLLAWATSAVAQGERPITEILVRLGPLPATVHTSAVVRSLALTTGTQEAGQLAYQPVQRLALNGQDLAATLATLRADPRVAYAEPNYPVYALAAPSDPAVYTLQWGFRRVEGVEALARRLPPAAYDTVILAIVDTGVDDRHPDLASRFVPGAVIKGGGTQPRDRNGHGTHVAGIAAATTGNSIGIAAPFPGRIMAVRVLDDTGSGSVADVADGIGFAVDHGARVINLSLGTTCTFFLFDTGDCNTLEDAVEEAHAAGAIMVAAAGNSGGEEKLYPASYGEVISVSAWGFDDDGIANFSSYHDQVELTAPGEHIYSTFLQGGYQMLSGTSMAAPLVAGAAANVLATLLEAQPAIATDPPRAAECVRQILRQSASHYAEGRSRKTGYGLLRLDTALDLVPAFQCP